MNFILILLIIVIVSGCVKSETARFNSWNDLNTYCNDPKSGCPKDLCVSTCVGGAEPGGCIRGCSAPDCELKSLRDCPKEGCEVVKDKDGEKICRRKNYPYP